MASTRRDELRTLLKTFGIQADEAVVAHLARNPKVDRVHVRLSLHDLTDYGGDAPDGELAFIVEGIIENQD